MKKKSKIFIPHYTAEDENWDDCNYEHNYLYIFVIINITI
jgi:hypothetical protein